MNFIQLFTLGYSQEYIVPGLLIGIFVGIYAFFRLSRLFNYYNLSKRNNLILRTIISILIIIPFFNIQSTVTITLAYLFMSSVIADIIGISYRLITKKGLKIHKNGILAILFFILIIASGIYGLNHIESNEFNLTTDKTNSSYKILYISDVHYDSVQNTQLLKDKLNEMNNTKPDIIILGGDIVDEHTSKEKMEEVFTELSKLNSTYGTYFIYGNHDRQPTISDYENGTKPFSNDDLNKTIQENGIAILSDNSTNINNDLVLIGREDAGVKIPINRTNNTDLLNNVDKTRYIIMLDHQPLDEANNSKFGVDLELSGHTHAGQIFPYGVVTDLAGNYNYGEYHIGNMTQIVSSGFGAWGIPLRNQGQCEYVIININ